MELLDVYSLYNVTPVKGRGSWIWDNQGKRYLDCYGGHAVISVGHSHPHYVSRLKEQLEKLAFYSNSIINPMQKELADLLGGLSGCDDYRLFLCNSGAEANENALKLSSFLTGRSEVLALKNSFHGRTSAAVAATHNEKIWAPINTQQKVTFIEGDDKETLVKELNTKKYCALIVECIQGVGGLDQVSKEFMELASAHCSASGTLLIADEVQSGFGRSGDFFAYQAHSIRPDIISMAKGMGNGFPVGGILVHPGHSVSKGMLGTTFGGNHLACAATLAVLEIIDAEALMDHVPRVESYFRNKAKALPGLKSIKGRGLMLGLEFEEEVAELRKSLIHDQQVFTGGASNKNLLRILPPLNITEEELDSLFSALGTTLQNAADLTQNKS